MTLTLQYVIDALNVGGLYALMALGIGLIFGIMRLINFAHGEMVMVGGYAMLLLIDLPGPAVVGVSILAVVALALAIERLAFRPLRDAAPSTLLVASFALSYFLQNLSVLLFGARPKPFVFASALATDLQVGPVRIALLQLVSMGLTLAALAGLTVLLKRTSIGVQLRAASQDFRAARLCGVRANSVIAFAFAISGALAWIVSLIYSAQIGQLSPAMGVRPVVIGFVAEQLRIVAADHVLTSQEDLREFRDPFWHLDWDDYEASAVVAPESVEEIQAIVRLANEHRVPLWTTSQGRNNGYGGSSPRVRGSVVVEVQHDRFVGPVMGWLAPPGKLAV